MNVTDALPGWRLVREPRKESVVDIPEPTPLSDAALARLPEFMEALEERLRAGKKVYGDSSFEKSPVQLLEEQRQEAADICGWGAILWLKLTVLMEAQGRLLGRD